MLAVCQEGLVLWLCGAFIKCFSASREIDVSFLSRSVHVVTYTDRFPKFQEQQESAMKPSLPNIVPAHLLVQLDKQDKRKYKTGKRKVNRPTQTGDASQCLESPEKITQRSTMNDRHPMTHMRRQTQSY